jgi:hypothetical protein
MGLLSSCSYISLSRIHLLPSLRILEQMSSSYQEILSDLNPSMRNFSTHRTDHPSSQPSASTSQPARKQSSKRKILPRTIKHQTKAEMLKVASASGPMRALNHIIPPSSNDGPTGDSNHEGQQYDEQPVWAQLRIQGSSDPRRFELAEILRRHNYSMQGIQGHNIQAQVRQMPSKKSWKVGMNLGTAL